MKEKYRIGQIVYAMTVPFMSRLDEKFVVIHSANVMLDGKIINQYPWRVITLGEEDGPVFVGLDDIRPITKEEKLTVALIKMGAKNVRP